MPDIRAVPISYRCISYRWLVAVLAVYTALLCIYSQTLCFTWDEGYHLVAAQLVIGGRKPYIDFCFPQSPLNAYWNAAWMRVLGESWRVPQGIAALVTAGAVFLVADFVFFRFPVPGWRFAAAITAGLAAGLNAMLFVYGPVAQPYGLCLLMLVLAFRSAVRAVDRTGPLPAGASGFFAGAAAASSLLTAAAAPALLLWTLRYNRAGSRAAKLSAFFIGALIPFAPVVLLFAQGPRQTWFNLFQYHVFFRSVYWPDTARHDLEILTSWIDSGQALIIGALAVSGVVFVASDAKWPASVKQEFYLCGWLAAALSAEAAFAHPTFARYFLLGVPFLAIPAAAGLYAMASRVFDSGRPMYWAVPVALLLALGLGRTLYERRDMERWSDYEKIARKVDQLAPPNAPLLAGEPIYFLTRRTPPPGFELTSYTHQIGLPPAEAALLHITGEAEVKRQVKAGTFAVACSCFDSEIEQYRLREAYNHSVDIHECTVFWDRKR